MVQDPQADDVFVRVILAEPSHPGHRLAYATWLEGQGRPEWGRLLRSHCTLTSRPVEDRTFLAVLAGFREHLARCDTREVVPLGERNVFVDAVLARKLAEGYWHYRHHQKRGLLRILQIRYNSVARAGDPTYLEPGWVVTYALGDRGGTRKPIFIKVRDAGVHRYRACLDSQAGNSPLGNGYWGTAYRRAF